MILTFFAVILTSFSGEKYKILIIGDSISIGYTPFIQEALSDQAIVVHNQGNARYTGFALGKITEWIGMDDYDIIQFNWGLHDMAYRQPEARAGEDAGSRTPKLTHTLEEYRANLDSLVRIMTASTRAKLIFVSTTYVPENAGGRLTEDPARYNEVAREVMKQYGITVNDIYEQSVKIHRKYGRKPNNVHYNSEGYRELSKLMIPFLEREMEGLRRSGLQHLPYNDK